MLLDKTFTTSRYTLKQIYEPKARTIYKLPYFPDRIIHHAVMQVIQPIWDRVFIRDLYSAIPGKGLHHGSYRLRDFLRDRENTQYCLKFDISKFYPSINHDILLNLIRKKIKCPDTLWLLEDVIRSPGGSTNIPIGNYLSQYFGNIYLNEFDHWIKEAKGQKYYIRYCDDGVILHKDLAFLKGLQVEIEDYMRDNLELSMNPKTRILQVDSQGIDFLGYRHFRNYTLLRKSSAKKFKKKISDIQKHHNSMDPLHVLSSIMSYIGWLQHCNSHNLVRKYILQNTELRVAAESAARTAGVSNSLLKYISRCLDDCNGDKHGNKIS